jgi:hypothetical protein
MFTLYRTENAATAPMEDAEFYTLFIDPKLIEGKLAFCVRELHGWWNEKEQRPEILAQTLSTEEGFPTRAGAVELFNRQARKRVADGFSYANTPDYWSDDPRTAIVKKLA